MVRGVGVGRLGGRSRGRGRGRQWILIPFLMSVVQPKDIKVFILSNGVSENVYVETLNTTFIRLLSLSSFLYSVINPSRLVPSTE